MVIIATPHDSLADSATGAFAGAASTCWWKSPPHGVRGSCGHRQSRWRRARLQVRVGFNHRYHRAFRTGQVRSSMQARSDR